MQHNTFLVEIGTEELPPTLLKQLAEALALNFTAQLEQSKLNHGQILWYASPRRLALKVLSLAAVQADTELIKRGPTISQSFDTDGKPTKAAEKWAQSCGIAVSQAENMSNDKGQWLVYRLKQKGLPVTKLLYELTKAAIEKLPLPTTMRWSDKQIEFIRPVHTLTMLYGDTLITGSLLGIASNRIVYGHRFMGEQQLFINHADDYPAILETRGKVIADYQKRKRVIENEARSLAKTLNGHVELTESLLDEVTSLVEWPVVLTAKFEKKYLKVPAEILTHTMKIDQKYFPLYDQAGRLLPHFIFVANIVPPDINVIINGNERVIKARLADAEFFYQTDLNIALQARLPMLESLLFQQNLGSMRDKSERISLLAEQIAKQINANSQQAKRAGLLCKCDLITNTVFEFPETQGIMGMYSARHDGENESVAEAIGQHYQPKFAGDNLPSSLISSAVAIADKMDTLVGIFGIGLHPKGDKDPFALRRAALGILRIIIEQQLPLDIHQLATLAAEYYRPSPTNQNVVADVTAFIRGRFRSWYLEKGYQIDTILAVLATNPTKPVDFDARVKAVAYFKTLSATAALATANKRVAHMLSKTDDAVPNSINAALLTHSAEIDLAKHVTTLAADSVDYLATSNYKQLLIALSTLESPLDTFFQQVMVMVDDATTRKNRLALLKQLQQLFLQVADISLLKS